MAKLPLSLIHKSVNFTPKTIAIHHEPNDGHSDLFTPVHGDDLCVYSNGTHPDNPTQRVRGAFDCIAQENHTPLPRLFLTGADRQENNRGWCVGDLAITNESSVFKDGSVIQLFEDDGSDAPLWALVHGKCRFRNADGNPGAWALYSSVTRITPQYDPKPQEGTSTMTRKQFDCVDSEKLTKEQVQRFIDDCVATGKIRNIEIGIMDELRYTPVVKWDKDNDIFSYTGIGSSNDVTEEYMTSIIPGCHVYTKEMTATQIMTFVEDIVSTEKVISAAPMWPSELAGEDEVLGWDSRDDTLYTLTSTNRNVDKAFSGPNLTSQYRLTSAPTTEKETSGMFKKDDRVVPNGFKAGAVEHAYGSNPVMEQWEKDKTVLTVRAASGDRVRAGDTRDDFTYHPAELRIALPEEIQKTDTNLQTGTVLRHEGGVYFVFRATPDSDGDIATIQISTGNIRHIRVTGPDKSEFKILGTLDENGAYNTESDSIDQDPLTWRKGDVVECIREEGLTTRGKRYILGKDGIDSDRDIYLEREDDGTPGYRSPDCFRKVA